MNGNNIDDKFDLLLNICNNKEYHNKYCFANEYIPFVQIRKGFDYIDAYMTSMATNNYFLFEKNSIDQIKYQKEAFFRCLYLNNKGQIEHIIKRKISVEIEKNDSLNIDKNKLPSGVSRYYDKQRAGDEILIQKIISIQNFNYQCLIKKDNVVTIYTLYISNNNSEDLIVDCHGEELSKPFFIEAKVIYNDKGEFIDLEIIN